MVEDYLWDELLGNVYKVPKSFFNPVDDGDSVGIATLFQNREVNGGLAVNANDVGLDGLRIDRSPDIAHEDRGLSLADGFEGHAVNVCSSGDLTIRVKVVVKGANLHVSCGENQVGLVDLTNHVHGAQLVGLQFERVHVNHNLAVTSTKGLGDGSSGDVGNLVSDGVLTEVVELGFVEALAL